jgi:hypothetical protein
MNTHIVRSLTQLIVGANLADMVRITIMRGCVSNTTSIVAGAFTRLWEELYWAHQPDDNIQVDGSFHQHSGGGRSALMAGNYGAVFSSDMLNLLSWSHGTEYRASDAQLGIFSALVLDGQQWMVTPAATWDWTVIGRSDSSPGPHSCYLSPSQISTLTSSDRVSEARNFAALLSNHRSNHRSGGLTPNESSSEYVPIHGNRHFWDSDYMVHRRPGWMLSIRMYVRG